MFEASVHIHVGLGQAPCLQKTQPPPHNVASPSRVRRRARHAEARRQAAEEAEQVEAEQIANNEGRQVEKTTPENSVALFDEAGNAISTSDDAVEVVDKVDATVNDEVCPNDEYFPELEKTVKIKCSIQLFILNNWDIDLR